MADTALDTIQGIIARLNAVTAVTAIVSNRIYTAVPQQSVFPYLVIGLDSDDWSTKSSSDMQHSLTVQCFSRYDGVKQALEVRSAVVDALDRQEANVTITGHTLVLLQKSGINTVFRESDGKTTQSVVQFNIIVQS